MTDAIPVDEMLSFPTGFNRLVVDSEGETMTNNAGNMMAFGGEV